MNLMLLRSRRFFFRIESTHRLADAVENPGFAAGDGFFDHRVDCGFFLGKKLGEHELGRVDPRRDRTAAHAEAWEVERVEALYDRLEAVVASVGAGGAQANLAEGERDVVAHDEQAGWRQLFGNHQREERITGEIHIRERLDKKTVGVAQANRRRAHLARGLAPTTTARGSQRFEHAKTEIVPRFFITRTGIAEAGNYEFSWHEARNDGALRADFAADNKALLFRKRRRDIRKKAPQ